LHGFISSIVAENDFLSHHIQSHPKRRFARYASTGKQSIQSNQAEWDKKFKDLVEFQEKYGHTNVPLGNPLGKWVYLQRRLYKDQKLPLELENLLNSVQFNWDLTTDGVEWDQMLKKLKDYEDKHGDCFVPKKFVEDPILGLWVSEQRTAKRERRLSEYEISSLDKLGFSWQPKNQCGSKFMIGLRKLEIFRDKFDHCNVPVDYEDQELVLFVSAQREARSKGKLSEKRIAYLDGMKFDWEG